MLLNQKGANIAEMSQVLVDNGDYFDTMGSGGKGGGNHQRPPKIHHRPKRGSRMDEPELDLSGMQETIGKIFNLLFIIYILNM